MYLTPQQHRSQQQRQQTNRFGGMEPPQDGKKKHKQEDGKHVPSEDKKIAYRHKQGKGQAYGQQEITVMGLTQKTHTYNKGQGDQDGREHKKPRPAKGCFNQGDVDIKKEAKIENRTAIAGMGKDVPRHKLSLCNGVLALFQVPPHVKGAKIFKCNEKKQDGAQSQKELFLQGKVSGS